MDGWVGGSVNGCAGTRQPLHLFQVLVLVLEAVEEWSAATDVL